MTASSDISEAGVEDRQGNSQLETHDPRIEAFARWIIKHRLWVIAASLLLAAFCGIGLAFLKFDPDSRLFLGPQNPYRLTLERVEKTFNKANNVIFIVVPKDGNVFSPRSLSLVERLTDHAWQLPYSFRVDSLATHQEGKSETDSITFDPLYKNGASLTQADIDRVRDAALSSDLLVGRLVSPTGDVAAVTVFVHLPTSGTREAIFAITEAAQDLAREMRSEVPKADIRLSGGIIADFAFAEAAKRETNQLVPIMIVLIFIILAIGYRSLTGTLITMLVVALSTAVGMGMGGWFGFSLNAGTAGAPIMIMVLSIAHCVHLLTNISHYRAAGYALKDAIIRALEVNLLPIVITTLTTVVGFLALNFSESPPLRELGNIVAMGEAAGLLFSVTLLPAVQSLLPTSGAALVEGESRSMLKLANFTIRNRRPLLWIFAGLLALSAVGLSRISIDDNIVEYFDDSFAFRRDTDFFEDRLGAFHMVLFSVDSRREGGITSPAYLAKLDAFSNWLEQQPNVSHVFTVAKSLRAINKMLRDEDRLPESDDIAAQYFLFMEMFLSSGHDLSDIVNVNKSASLVSVGVAHADSRRLQEFGRASEQWLRDNAPELVTPATGLSMAYAYLTTRNMKAMLAGTLTSVVVVSLLMLLVMRNLRLGLVSLVPNIIPAVLAFGAWGFLVGEVNLAISVVGAMTYGIVVDDTVHCFTKYLMGRKMGLGREDAIRYTYALVGPAMIMMSIPLIVGFGVLAFSGFAVTSQTGMMSAMTIAIALVCDLFLVPPLLLSRRLAGP